MQPQAVTLRIFRDIETSVVSAFDALVSPTATQLMGELKFVAVTGATLYLVIVGLMIATGGVRMPLFTFLKTGAKIALIGAFALSADLYLGGVVSALEGFESGLVSVMQTGISRPVTDIFGSLDASLSEGFSLSLICWEKAKEQGITGVGDALVWMVAGLLIVVATIFVTLIGGAIVLVAKFSLAVLFALGPLFVLSLMFPQTEKLFSSWFSQVLNFIIQVVLVSVVLSFQSAMFQRYLSTGDLLSPTQNPLLVASQVATVGLLFAWITLKSGGLATGLAGGVSMGVISLAEMARPMKTGGAMIAGAGKGGASVVRGGASALKGAGRAGASLARGIGGGALGVTTGIGATSYALLHGVGGMRTQKGASSSMNQGGSSSPATSMSSASTSMTKAPLAMSRAAGVHRTIPNESRPRSMPPMAPFSPLATKTQMMTPIRPGPGYRHTPKPVTSTTKQRVPPAITPQKKGK